MDIISKIKEVGLKGCGGACFPTADKWQAVKDSFAVQKYVVANGSEGEPGVEKDAYLLAKYPQAVIEGMRQALLFIKDRGVKTCAYLYLNPLYYKRYGNNLKRIIASKKVDIRVIAKPHSAGYIGGEETAVLNAIEKKKIEPRLKPPFPTVSGLWGYPTIVNNIETFYHVGKMADGVYESVRFYSINGDCRRRGVYEFTGKKNIIDVLKDTGNFPDKRFFVQVGGGASGEVLNDEQLDCPATGAMSLTIYQADKWQPQEVLRKWIGFFLTESCGQCTPCREGTYRLFETINSKKVDWQLIKDLIDNLGESSFCGLGLSIPLPIKSYINNVLLNKVFVDDFSEKKMIAKVFKS
jgi:NADH:ubiquinone oxidoreductase subunit F (NADH-binding)